ncbi:T9SS type A sorting domain-containing protein, partial [candidate division KSB1 bacterium]|nr:T9SS type A sorting domain-containing protein [candidate division KSB1 bacterium]
YESMTEELLNMEANGAIAVIAAARLVGSSQNITFNKEFYNTLFPTAHHKLRLGDALVATKNNRGNFENDQKLILFGDPTMHLANPEYQAKITDITPDSIKALSQMSIAGKIEKSGELWTAFNGRILVKSYDSKKNRIYQIEEESDLRYVLPGNTIFRGTASVENGYFDIKFIVPKDITYGGNDGRFSLYFWDDEVDGTGYKNNLTIGGTESNLHDRIGPEISLKFNDDEFEHDGYTNPTPNLKIEITDTLSGVNIAGDIGHNINLTVDDEKINVTDLFNYYQDSFLSGQIQKQLGPLNEGVHDLVVKAWDNSNNSSELRTQFTVVADNELVLDRLLNYPNPFANETEFTFWTNSECEATIKIYTVAGRLIKKIDHIYAKYGFNHVRWDGLDEDGEPIANGVYLYKIYAKAHFNGRMSSDEAIEKLMIMR